MSPTPGPYTIHQLTFDTSGCGTSVCGIRGIPVAFFGTVCDTISADESQVNAMVFVNALELLATCKFVAAWLESFSVPPTSTCAEKEGALERLNKAIAAVTTNQPGATP